MTQDLGTPGDEGADARADEDREEGDDAGKLDGDDAEALRREDGDAGVAADAPDTTQPGKRSPSKTDKLLTPSKKPASARYVALDVEFARNIFADYGLGASKAGILSRSIRGLCDSA